MITSVEPPVDCVVTLTVVSPRANVALWKSLPWFSFELSVKPSSVRKRMKRKDFAKQVSRERIQQCERIGLDLDEFCAIAVGSMQRIAEDLGL